MTANDWFKKNKNANRFIFILADGEPLPSLDMQERKAVIIGVMPESRIADIHLFPTDRAWVSKHVSSKSLLWILKNTNRFLDKNVEITLEQEEAPLQRMKP